MSTQKSILDQPTTPADKRLWPASLTVKGFKGIKEMILELGRNFTLFCGPNGAGKSSLLDAAKNITLGGAALAGMARIEDGEPMETAVTIVLKSGDGGEQRVTKTDEKTPDIKSRIGNSAAFETIKRPAEHLRKISDQGADPAKFLTAPPKEQLEMLLAGIPLVWDQARVDEILGGYKSVVDAEALPMEHLYPLQRVAAIRDSIFRARTGVNRDEKAKRSAADQTRRNAPSEIPEDVTDRLERLHDEITDLYAKRADIKRGIESEFKGKEAAAAAERDTAIQAARTAYDKRVAEATASVAGMKSEVSRIDVEIPAKEAQTFALENQKKEAIRAKTMHDTAADFDSEADSLKGTADGMSAVIEALDRFKAEMASDLPIHGLTIDGGEIKIDGVPFAQLNTAKKVAIAFSVATLRSKGLPLRACFIDNAECLDEQHRQFLFDMAKAEGVYIFAAMVTADETLTVVRG